MNYEILINKKNPITEEKLNGFKLIGVKDENEIEYNFIEIKTYKQFLKLQKEASKSGCYIILYGGYRSLIRSKQLFDHAKDNHGEEHALKLVALPGFSEHSTGLAIDYLVKKEGQVVEIEDYNMEEVKLVSKIAHRYGFIIRYPEGKEAITGYNYEPWHLRYVGKKLAIYLYEHQLTLEEYYIEKENSGVREMDYTVLVNKKNPLPVSKEPACIVKALTKYKDNVLLEKTAYKNWLQLKEAAIAKGYQLEIESGYRSSELQGELLDKLIKEKGEDYAYNAVAKPGYSEHQTGLAIDYCLFKDNKFIIEQELTELEETKFVSEVAYKYGFIIRYPKGKEDITGYQYEPWHLRYVGKVLATILYKSGLTLDEYYMSMNK